MKIDEFIERVNEHDGMRAKEADNRIVVGTPNNMGIFSIPEDATNLIEIDTWATSNSLYWKKADREYLSSLIEEFLHTPVKERFSEKKYRLKAGSGVLENFGSSKPRYVESIDAGWKHFTLFYGKPTEWSEQDLMDIESTCPGFELAIEEMKEPVEE